jgi:5-methylcytosine-specific restriction endonuclease McrA
MIFVDKSKVSIPGVLIGKSSRGYKEKTRAIAHYSKPNQNKVFKFKVYSDRSVKERLIELFNDKCAYCESKVSHIYSGDIEHFRPKGKISEALIQKPGYYWLATEWDNLLFSCRNCNVSIRATTP